MAGNSERVIEQVLFFFFEPTLFFLFFLRMNELLKLEIVFASESITYVNEGKYIDTQEEMKNFCFGNVACNLLFYYPLNCLWSIYDNFPVLQAP